MSLDIKQHDDNNYNPAKIIERTYHPPNNTDQPDRAQLTQQLFDKEEWAPCDNVSGESLECQNALTNVKRFKCTVCFNVTNKKSNLTAHQSTHSGEKPFKCLYCDYATAQKSHLTTHQRRHTGDKPFKCLDCDFATAWKSYLINHQRKHTGEKPFKCSVCDYAASQKSNLTTHQRKHSGDIS